ncbi:hypothetical protein BYT27DRAFT_7184283 [Phlegmacium glaucopus]|nr:hypothetical protein BYT27DRAFT_7184283 [Phlegmacium glaucopus]
MDPSHTWLYLASLALNQPPPPVLVQQLLWAQATMPPMPHIHSSHGHPYPDMGQQQHHHRPNSGPMRHQHHGSLRMTEAPTPYHILHESSSTIASDHATGSHPINARMGADNSGADKVRPPSGNPRMANCSSIQQKRKKPYYRRRSGPSQTQKERRGKEDLSTYEFPLMELRTGVTAGGSNTPAVIPVPAPAPPMASTSAAPIPTPASTSAGTPATAEIRRRGSGNTKTKVRRRPVYDDDSDVHRVSSGSETD